MRQRKRSMKVNTGLGYRLYMLKLDHLRCLFIWGYKLDLNKPRVVGPEDKAIVEKNKRVIQDKFWRELGLIVDMPRQGAGNSNTGNVARRFFEHHESSASILNIKPSIIYKMGQVLEVIRSRFPIDPIIFEEYCNALYNEYKDYKMFPLTPTVEEAQETRHKHFKSYLEGLSGNRATGLTKTADLNEFSSDFNEILSTCVYLYYLPIKKI